MMTERQAFREARRRWNKAFTGRVFICTSATEKTVGVVECPGEPHRGFNFSGRTWEEAFQAHDQAMAPTLRWRLKAVTKTGEPVKQVADHISLPSLEWDHSKDWVLRITSAAA